MFKVKHIEKLEKKKLYKVYIYDYTEEDKILVKSKWVDRLPNSFEFETKDEALKIAKKRAVANLKYHLNSLDFSKTVIAQLRSRLKNL